MLKVARIDPVLIEKILSSPPFVRSDRLRLFLTLLAERSGNPETRRIKETEIGVLVFDRHVGYDPKTDSIVRAEATRLRRKLREYYATDGKNDPLRIVLPPGKYELVLEPRDTVVPDHSDVGVLAGTEHELFTAPARLRFERRWAVWALVASLIGVAALVVVWQRSVPQPRLLEIAPFTALPGRETSPSFSPDGKRVAFIWSGAVDGQAGLYVQAVGSDTAQLIAPSSRGLRAVAWSRDGNEIAFVRPTDVSTLEVAVVPAGGGTESVLARIHLTPGTPPCLSWSADGQWLLTNSIVGNHNVARLILIQRHGTNVKEFAPDDISTSDQLDARFSHDGRKIAFVERPEAGLTDVFVADYPFGHKRQVTFDKTQVHGLDWGPGDRGLVVASQHGGGLARLWWISLDGHAAPVALTQPGGRVLDPASSAASNEIAFSTEFEDIGIWRRALDSADMSDAGVRFIASTGRNSSPQVSPDGLLVAFRSSRTGNSETWIHGPRNTDRRITYFNGPLNGAPSWSPDGEWLAFDARPNGNADIFLARKDGSGFRQLTTEKSNEVVPRWSRDGKNVYFSSDRLGSFGIWREAVSGGAPELIEENGFAAVESPDGAYLYFASGRDSPGLWRKPLSGGVREPVIPDLAAGLWGNWAIGRKDLYYVERTRADGKTTDWLIRMNLATREKHRVFRIQSAVWWDGGLAISADERWIYYVNLDRVGTDIFVGKLGR